MDVTDTQTQFFDVSGQLYDGVNSKSHDSVLRVYTSGDIAVSVDGNHFEPIFPESFKNTDVNSNSADSDVVGSSTSSAYQFFDFDISPPLGAMARQLRLPNDAMFETSDHTKIKAVLDCFDAHKGGFIHAVESNLWAIILSVIVVLAFSFVGVKYGVPYTAKLIATSLPDSIYEYMDDDLVEQFDSFMLDPSDVNLERQQALHDKFKPILAAYPNIPLEVHFRSSDDQANAFALPSGDLVFLDGLVKLAEKDEEIIAVLCHEIAHVYYRHGIQSTIQSSLVYWVLMLMTGDITAGTDLIVSLPAIVAGLSYSRDMETEADTFALELMQKLNIDPIHFANILEKMVDHTHLEIEEEIQNIETEIETHIANNTEGEVVKDPSNDKPESEQYKKTNKEENAFLAGLFELAERYLSTHPDTEQRIARFQKASQIFNNKNTFINKGI